MPQAAAPSTQTRRQALPLVGRQMELRHFRRESGDDSAAPLATAEIVFSTGAPVRRYDWYRERYYNEVLVLDADACNLARLQRGAPLLNTHSAWSLEDQLGVCENPRVESGVGTIDAKFSRRQSVAGYVQDVADGIIRNVSVGYSREVVEMHPPEGDGEIWTYRVVRWTPMEVSLVPIPADMDAQVRSAGGRLVDAQGHELRTFECEFIEARAIPVSPPERKSGMDKTPEQIEAERRAAEAEAERQRIADEARAAEAARSGAITELCQRHGVTHLAATLIRDGRTVDQARSSVLDEIARRDAASGGHHNTRVETVRDEVQTRLAGMEEVILARVDASAKLTDNGRQFRSMSLIELGRDYLAFRGVDTRGMTRLELATQVLQFRSNGMLSSSDFGSLLANVAGKRLRRAYDENNPSYRRWARRAPNAPDFKQMSVVNLSAAPDLLQVTEHGEFKYGSMSDGKEVYSMLTYGRIVSFTRQSLVNDDLRGFDRLIGAFGNSAARLENRIVYSILTANAALSDTVALFHANHGNLAGAGTVINVDNLGAGRKAMRLQKGLQSEELNLAPSYLIVPAALEQVAYQYTSANYVPATAATINEFRAGGRTSVEPVVEPILDANSATAWYLAADNAQVDTVEFCYLDGAEGPVIESDIGFEVDGISWKCREDFAAKAIDFRGLYKNPGA